jgi:hypothetical protein
MQMLLKKMRITSAGNVLIGTTTDSGQRVSIAVNTDTVGVEILGSSTSYRGLLNTHELYLYNKRVMRYNAGMLKLGDGADDMVINGGNVGIGTSSPSEKLQVSGTLAITQNDTAYSGGYFTKIKSGYNANPFIIESKYGDLIKAEDYGKSLSFHTGEPATSERLRITSAGNVGIGTTSPSFSLDINSGTANSAFRVLSTDRYTGIKFEDSISSDTLFYDGQNNLMYLGSTNFRAVNLIATGTGSFTGQVTIPATPIATTDAASKSYVDAQTTGLSVFAMLLVQQEP